MESRKADNALSAATREDLSQRKRKRHSFCHYDYDYDYIPGAIIALVSCKEEAEESLKGWRTGDDSGV